MIELSIHNNDFPSSPGIEIDDYLLRFPIVSRDGDRELGRDRDLSCDVLIPRGGGGGMCNNCSYGSADAS